MGTETEKSKNRTFNHLAIIYGKIECPSEPLSDGRYLARQCIDQLKILPNPALFPPNLLIVLASTEYLEKSNPGKMLTGIYAEFEENGNFELNLIGSSVHGIVVDDKIVTGGVLLICLASRIYELKIAYSQNVNTDPKGAISRVINQLNLHKTHENIEKAINPLGTRWMLTFFPSPIKNRKLNSYTAYNLHQLLRKGLMGRIPITGGVSASISENSPGGYQFLGRSVLKDTLLCALIDSDFPFALNISSGFESTGVKISLKRSQDKNDVYESNNKKTLLKLFSDANLNNESLAFRNKLDKASSDFVIPSHLGNSTFSINPSKSLENQLEVYLTKFCSLSEMFPEIIHQALHRVSVNNPVAGILFISSHVYSYLDRKYGSKNYLGIENAKRILSETIGRETPILGALFEGEFGLDQFDRSQLMENSVSAIILGDEIRQRGLIYRGFRAIAKCGPQLQESSTLSETASQCLRLIQEAGFNSAMLSFIYSNKSEEWIIGKFSKGPLFDNRIGLSQFKVDDNHILSKVIKNKNPLFVSDLKVCKWNYSNSEDIDNTTNNQWVFPIKNAKEDVIAILQIDLGDISYLKRLSFIHKVVLKAIGNHISSAISRATSREELRIERMMDELLVECMSSESIEQGLQKFIEIMVKEMGADAGHIRLVQYDEDGRKLDLTSGCGKYFEKAYDLRKQLDFMKDSQIWNLYRMNNLYIVNDTATDEEFKDLCNEIKGKEEFISILNQRKSYVTGSIRDEWNLRPIATLSLTSKHKWFFSSSITRSIGVIQKKIGYLIEHLNFKMEEEKLRKLEKESQSKLKRSKIDLESSQKALEFILETNPKLETLALGDRYKILNEAVSRFQGASNATTGSLFLWDEELKLYVLRGQSGWKDGRWLNAARYSKDDPWSGNFVSDRTPTYIPDLEKFKRSQSVKKIGKYTKQMFGTSLTNSTKIEAMVLPLRIGRRLLGFLTLHRIDESTRPLFRNSFTTTCESILKEAGNNMAALVDAVLREDIEIWEREEERRKSNVLNEIIKLQKTDILDSEICKILLKYYRASKIEFYGFIPENENKIVWRIGWNRKKEGTNSDNYIRIKERKEPDRIISTSSRSKSVEIERLWVKDSDRNVPEKLAMEGIVIRAAVPMIFADRLIGIFDITWGPRRKKLIKLPEKHSGKHLRLLCGAIAGVFVNRELREKQIASKSQANQSNQAAEVMGVMISLSGHGWWKLQQKLLDKIGKIKNETNEHQKVKLLNGMIGDFESGIKEIDNRIRYIEKIPQRKSGSWSVKNLINEALEQTRLKDENVHKYIEVMQLGKNNEMKKVWCDPDCVKISLCNIFNVAKEIIPNGGLLRIHTRSTHDNTGAHIIISHPGKLWADDGQSSQLCHFDDKVENKKLPDQYIVAEKLLKSMGCDFEFMVVPGGFETSILITLPFEQEREKNNESENINN